MGKFSWSVLTLLLLSSLTMLDTPGDLIPVVPAASTIPWTRRRSQILNFLHRGPVSFTTLVYDTNVGDISPLSSYFNPQRISEKELNCKFGQYPVNGGVHPEEVKRIGSEPVVMPRLLLYPERRPELPQRSLARVQAEEVKPSEVEQNRFQEIEDSNGYPPARLDQDQVKVQRTLNWVLSQDKKTPQEVSGSSEELTRTNSTPDLFLGLANPKSFLEDPLLDLRQTKTVPSTTLTAALEMDSKWSSWDTDLAW